MFGLVSLKIEKRPPAQTFLLWGLFVFFLFGWTLQLIPIFSADVFLELFLMVLACVSFLQAQCRLKKQVSLWVSFLILYVFSGFFVAVIIRGENVLDFLMTYKFAWYLTLLAILSNKPLVGRKSLEHLLRVALVMFLFVYVSKIAIGNSRPTFFTENNFELLFLSLLYFSSYVANGRSRPFDTALFLIVAIVSGSRSGSALAAVAILFSFDFRSVRRPSTLALVALGIAGVVGALYVFAERAGSGSLEEIDRYRFFQNFLFAVNGWNFFDYLFGAPRITSLPPEVCSALSYYETLKSFKGDGSCYSVILHSFNMRIIFDHGVMMTIVIGVFIWRILGDCTIKSKICVLLLLFLNGLSVSSINSVYGALGIALVSFASASGRCSQEPDIELNKISDFQN